MKQLVRRRLLLCLLIAACTLSCTAPQRETPRQADTATETFAAGDIDTDSASEPSTDEVIRVHVDWGGPEEPDRYDVGAVVLERSGTPALYARSRTMDPLGSFKAYVRHPSSEEVIYQSSLGTGQVFRTFVPNFAFRFPRMSEPFLFTLEVENAETGEFDEVLRTPIDPNEAEPAATHAVEVRHLRDAEEEPHIAVVFYAEAYPAGGEERFFDAARRAIETLARVDFPGLSRMSFDAVFRASTQSLGAPADLGDPIQVRDSYLGLYYPYWCDWFRRWNLLLYPTNTEVLMTGLGQVPYDYPIVLVDSSGYWGTGNYDLYTALPSDNPQFDYLLTHEIGHFFGLNEEYSGGGTELLFGPGVTEPFSQNLSFTADRAELKWAHLVTADTPLPTDPADYDLYGIGAYPGGYAGDDDRSYIPVPDGVCIMSSADTFCDVCSSAILAKVEFDVGG
jgi:hypothetical protein